jgi:hypothetical protein
VTTRRCAYFANLHLPDNARDPSAVLFEEIDPNL